MKINVRYSILYNSYVLYMFRNNRIAKEIKYQYSKTVSLMKNERIITRVNNQWITCPYSHKLAIYQKIFPKYDKQLSIICSFISHTQKKKINIIDVGANIGDTVINIGLKDAYYLLIEGNPDYNIYIQDNLKNKYHYNLEKVFLSDTISNQYHLFSEFGTGKLISIKDGTIQNSNHICTLDFIIQKYPNKHFDLLKIDTDGFDFKILRSAMTLLKSQNPYTFFEWDPILLKEQNEDPLSIFLILNDIGYTQ